MTVFPLSSDIGDLPALAHYLTERQSRADPAGRKGRGGVVSEDTRSRGVRRTGRRRPLRGPPRPRADHHGRAASRATSTRTTAGTRTTTTTRARWPCPGCTPGRRWVATRDLQLLRYPEKSAVAQPVTAGCYLSTYWITDGRYDDHMRWTVGINKRLNRDGRVYQDRTHVFTAFQDHEATVYRDGAAGPRDYHALDHPYAGLVLQVDRRRGRRAAGRAAGVAAVPAPAEAARGLPGGDGDGLPADPAARRTGCRTSSRWRASTPG